MQDVILKKKLMLNLNGFEICQDSIIQHFQASESWITICISKNQDYCQIAISFIFDKCPDGVIPSITTKPNILQNLFKIHYTQSPLIRTTAK